LRDADRQSEMVAHALLRYGTLDNDQSPNWLPPQRRGGDIATRRAESRAALDFLGGNQDSDSLGKSALLAR
jgi:hypothetical protein